MRRHISDEVVDLIPSFLQFIQKCYSERIIEIGPHNVRASFFETQFVTAFNLLQLAGKTSKLVS